MRIYSGTCHRGGIELIRILFLCWHTLQRDDLVLSARGFYDRNVCASAERVEIRNKVQVAKIRAYKASNERNYRAENYMNTLRKSLKVRGNSDLPLSV